MPPLMPTTISNKQSVLIVCFLFGLLSLLFPHLPGHGSDMYCWQNWSWHIYHQGLRNAYDSGTNYLPLYQYFMWFYAKLVGNGDHIGHFIGYLRCFTLLFDLAGIWLVYQWTDRKWSWLALVLLNILNIAYSYNTIIWGQVDGIMATLCFAAVYFAWRKQVVLSCIMMVLAINMKLQSIVFLPLWGLLLIHALVQEKGWKGFFAAIAAIIATQAILLFPFMLKEGGVDQVLKVVTESVDQYPRVSMNAFNFWHLAAPTNPWDIEDSQSFLAGISYKTAGLLLFFFTSALALFPVAKQVWIAFRRKDHTTINRELVWLSGALVGMLFFYFNTQMHERYSHPAMIFLCAYGFYTGRFLPFVLFCIAYVLHLEKILRFLELHNYETLVFHPKFIATLFAFLILLLYRLLLRTVKEGSRETVSKQPAVS